MDGVDAAIIETDGREHVAFVGSHYIPYDEGFKGLLRQLMLQACEQKQAFQSDDVKKAKRQLMAFHLAAVQAALEKLSITADQLDIIGIHGQTIYHAPEKGLTWQISDGEWLADQMGVSVVDQFRIADVEAGGEGAPLVPIYHKALMGANDHQNIALVNIGGVANITYLPARGQLHELVAFDTGPGNALIDQLMQKHFNKPYDQGGAIAASGQVDRDIISEFMNDPWFVRPYPKSLDRHHFDPYLLKLSYLLPADQIATATALTTQSIKLAISTLPKQIKILYVCGGGSHNATILAGLRAGGLVTVEAIEDRAESIEAEAFAYLAVRCRMGLPITFPGTTKAPQPMTGGRLYKVS